MAGRAQGYGITQQDMDASRLVFVSVKGAKPRRKVAVPVPDGYSWQDFCAQVQTKLKLSGVQSIHLAMTGEQITTVDDLQDIDELHVVEAAAQAPVLAASHAYTEANGHSGGPEPHRLAPGAATSATAAPSSHSLPNGHGAVTLSVDASADQSLQHAGLHRHQSMQRHPALSPGSELVPAPEQEGQLQGDDSKYVRRSSRLRRLLQRILPASMLQPALPVTTRDVQPAESRKGAGPGRRRKRQQSPFTARTLLAFFALLITLGTLLMLYNRISPRLPSINGLR